MSDPSMKFRDQLLNVQEMSPALRAGYQKELDALLEPPMTRSTALVGVVLAVALLILTALIVRADVYHHVRGLMLVGHIALAVGFLGACILIFRDLHRRRNSRRSVLSIASLLTLTAGILTVVALILGLRNPSDPKSVFSAFYVFVFYFACAIWALDTRIVNSELASREQSLRIECRLADLAEKLGK